MKSIILTHSGYQDQEVIYPYYRLQEEIGEEEGVLCPLVIAEDATTPIKGILGTSVYANLSYLSLGTHATKFLKLDLLVLPGGVKAMEKLRQDQNVLDFVAAWAHLKKPIASLCSGAQVLISARVDLRGRKIAAYPAMHVDIQNAGATFVNDVVVDGNIVSAPHYNNMSRWLWEAIRMVRSQKYSEKLKSGAAPQSVSGVSAPEDGSILQNG